MVKVVVVSLLLLLPQSTLAQSGGLDLESFLNRVSSENPRLRAEKAQIQVAESERIGAKLLPNPEFSYETGQSIFGADLVDGSTHVVALEIPLEIFGQRGLRRALAERIVEESRELYQIEHAEVLTEARRAFIETQIVQEHVTLHEEILQKIDEVLHIMRERVRLGTVNPYDLLRLELQASQIEAEYKRLTAELRAQEHALGTFMGVENWTGKIEPTQTLLSGQTLEKVREHPALRAKRTQLLKSDAELALTNRERWPVPFLSVGTQLATDEFGGALLAGIGIELPIFDRKQGEIARIQAERRATELEIHAMEFELAQNIVRAMTHVEALAQLEKDFETAAVGRLEDLSERAQKLFEEGVSGVLEIVDALETIVDIRMANLEVFESRIQAELEILELLPMRIGDDQTE